VVGLDENDPGATRRGDGLQGFDQSRRNPLAALGLARLKVSTSSKASPKVVE
jgi:hypothetical protein